MTTKTDIEQERALLPCPFCGGQAHIERTGTSRQSCLIACFECGAQLETGEQGKNCGAFWNYRASVPLQLQGANPFSPAAMNGMTKDELIRELQWALHYWMPSIAGDDTPDGVRAAKDARLLCGPLDERYVPGNENTPTYWEKVSALQSQDREDSLRLDWLESLGSVDVVKTLDGKTEVYAPHNDLVYAAAGSLREAIDHARRIEGET